MESVLVGIDGALRQLVAAVALNALVKVVDEAGTVASARQVLDAAGQLRDELLGRGVVLAGRGTPEVVAARADVQRDG